MFNTNILVQQDILYTKPNKQDILKMAMYSVCCIVFFFTVHPLYSNNVTFLDNTRV